MDWDVKLSELKNNNKKSKHSSSSSPINPISVWMEHPSIIIQKVRSSKFEKKNEQ